MNTRVITFHNWGFSRSHCIWKVMQASEFQFLKNWPFQDINRSHLISRSHKFSWTFHADIIFSLIQRERNICVFWYHLFTNSDSTLFDFSNTLILHLVFIDKKKENKTIFLFHFLLWHQEITLFANISYSLVLLLG